MSLPLHPLTIRAITPLALSAPALLFFACGGPESYTSTHEQGLEHVKGSCEPEDRPYIHPFMEGLQPGGVVLHDVKDDERGRRYLVGDWASAELEKHPTQHTGIQTMERRKMTAKEREELRELRALRKKTAERVVIAPDLRKKLYSEADHVQHAVNIHLADHPEYEPIIYKLERAIATGQVKTHGDRAEVFQSLLAVQQSQVRELMDKATDMIGSIGGKTLSTCENSPCMDAMLTAHQVELLAEHPLFSRFDMIHPLEENALRGTEVSRGTQMTQFHDANYMGDHNLFSFGVLRAGVLEHGGIDPNHLGFRDWVNSSDRVKQMVNCSNGLCSAVNSFSTVTNHSSGVSGLVMGDLTDDQDPNFTTTSLQRDRSGYGREADLYFWRAANDSNIDDALDNLIASDPHVLNMSISIQTGDAQCKGETSVSRVLNDVFEAGIPTFFAAGNNGTNNNGNCVVEEPGSAMGAFVVGYHTSDRNNDDETDVRYGAINPNSDLGGGPIEGKNRTIIDMTAAGCRRTMFDAAGGYTYNDCGTSFAAPTIAGGAIDLMDFYIDTYSSAIDNPGTLTANLLLMGDRQLGATSSTKLATKFSNRWGAGRFKMRRWDTIGLDWPYQWGSFNTCIDDGEVYYYNLNNGNPISSDVDAFKSVLWFYDRRHAVGTPIDNLDLRLQALENGVWKTKRSSTSTTDEKERIFYTDFSGNRKWRLRISGTDVSTIGAGCGLNSMRAYVAFFFEDSDRDDSNGPSAADVDPE